MRRTAYKTKDTIQDAYFDSAAKVEELIRSDKPEEAKKEKLKADRLFEQLMKSEMLEMQVIRAKNGSK